MEQAFEVAAPVEQVWKALIDVEHVAPCLPGAAVTGRNDDGSYEGSFSVKIGPTTASYTGKLEMEQVDEQSRTATMQAQGTDRRGQGGAKATIVSTLSQTGDGGTRIEVITDYHITGRLARFGRGGMIEDISERLLREFGQRLAASLVAEPAGGSGEPADTVQEGAATSVAAAADAGNGADPAGEAARPETTQPAAPVSAAGDEPPALSAQTPPPLDAGPLVASVLWERARRNPGPALAALLLVLMLVRRLRR